MPRIVIVESGARGLRRCRHFLLERSPQAAARAAQVIEHHLLLLEVTPEMGRPFTDAPHLRELVIPFGSAGYVALYRYDADKDTAYVLAFRHQRESGY